MNGKVAKVAKVSLALIVISLAGGTAMAATAVTPDSVKSWFDANAVLAMFAWGILHKYLPGMQKVENNLIPWFNVAGYVLAKLAGGAAVASAHASTLGAIGSALPNALGVLIAGATTNSVLASLIYETFGRTLIERWFHITKPLPPSPSTVTIAG